MQISLKTWNQYKNRLASIDKKAAEEMEAYIQRIGGFEDHAEEVIRYAYALASRYGEAAAAAACQMHEAVAEASGVRIPPAVPAEPPDYKEVARAVRGTVKNSSEKQIPRTVGRLVKRTGADTTLKNAERDGAQFAWIPMGDTCAFCLTLASRGWQHMSKNALKNGHAEHIHANCDCQYAIRFDDNTSIEGYDPEKYREMYENAEGDTPQEKINAMRREQRKDPAVRDKLNAQKRAADAKRKGLQNIKENDTINSKEVTERNRTYNMHNEKYGDSAIFVDEKYIESDEYKDRYKGITGNEEVDSIIAERAETILKERSGSFYETLVLFDMETGTEILSIAVNDEVQRTRYSEEDLSIIKTARDNGTRIVALHNHPTGWPPTADDCVTAYDKGYEKGITCGHNGTVHVYFPSEVHFSEDECRQIHDAIAEKCMYEKNMNKVLDTWKITLAEFGMKIKERR